MFRVSYENWEKTKFIGFRDNVEEAKTLALEWIEKTFGKSYFTDFESEECVRITDCEGDEEDIFI